MPSLKDIETALSFSPRFYDAVLAPDRWHEVMTDFMNILEADAAQITYGSLAPVEPVATFIVGHGAHVASEWLAYEHSLENDPRNARGFDFPFRPVRCRDLVSDDEFYASNIYRDLFEPSGLDHTLAVILPFEDRVWSWVLGFIRRKGRPQWSKQDCDKLQLYIPHLRQAALVAERLHNLERFNDAFAKAFDALSLATLIVSGGSHLIYANQAARQMLKSGSVIRETNGFVRTINNRAAQVFHSAVRDCAVSSALSASSRTLRQLVLPGRDGDTNFFATVSSANDASGLAKMPLSEVNCAIVFINDPNERYETATEQLQRLYGLTNTEAEIMAAYGSGATAAEIASMRRITRETVKTHLNAIRQKSGFTRKAEIIRVVSKAHA